MSEMEWPDDAPLIVGIIAVILAIRFWDKIRMYMQGRGWLGLRVKNQHSILSIVATLITWDQTYFFSWDSSLPHMGAYASK